MKKIHPISLWILFGTLGVLAFNCQEKSRKDPTDIDVQPDSISQNLKGHSETPKGEYFIHLSDVHLNLLPNESNCSPGQDTPPQLWSRIQQKLSDILGSTSPPKFMIFTGDLPAHNASQSAREQNIKTVFGDLERIVGKTPLFYAPGNNDALGGDYGSFSNAKNQTPISILGPATSYPALNADTIYSQHPKFGYYSARPFPGLRIIALNTIMLDRKYKQEDPQNCPHPPVKNCTDHERMEQLDWLAAQLAEADSMQEKAYLIMHIPPGSDPYSGSPYFEGCNWQNTFLDHITQYDSTISGIFYGHTHMDEIKRFGSSQNSEKFIAVGISCPGIGTCPGKNNPGFRTVYYNSQKEPTDYLTFWQKAGDTPMQAPYSFWEVYDPKGKHSPGQSIESFLLSKSLSEIVPLLSSHYKVGRAGKVGNTAAIDAPLCSSSQ